MDRREEYEKLFEAPFDFSEYIESQLRNIEDLDERRFAKAVLEGCLIKGIERTELMYNVLERRLYEELECKDKNFAIYTTVVPRDAYDPIGDFLYPVCPEDLPPDSYDTQVFVETLGQGKPVRMAPVFLQACRADCEKALQRTFQGVLLLSDGAELPGSFRLKPDGRYMDCVKSLYDLYCNNGITWTTVNTSYFSKCFSLELVLLQKELNGQEKIIGFQVDFLDLTQHVNYNFLPLWNVQQVLVESADFMMPCIDSVGWEHKVSVIEMGIENEYLIAVTGAIRDFRREKEDIIILTDEQKLPPVTVCKIARPKDKLPLGYIHPLLSNSKRDSFTRRYTEHYQKSILTRAELLRRIHELDFVRFLEFKEVQFIQDEKYCSVNYSMNPFIDNEIVDKTSKKILLFTFREIEKGYFLNEDILSFLISQLQLSFDEYRCEGVLV